MKYYALTLKNVLLTEIPTPQDYCEFMYNFKTKYPTIQILNSCYELDSHKRLHYHAIISGPSRICYKLIQLAYFHQDIQELKTDVDVMAFSKYIDKEKIKEVEYMFIDEEDNE